MDNLPAGHPFSVLENPDVAPEVASRNFRNAIALRDWDNWVSYALYYVLTHLVLAGPNGLSPVTIIGMLHWLNEGRLRRFTPDFLAANCAILETRSCIVGEHDGTFRLAPAGLMLLATLAESLAKNPDYALDGDRSIPEDCYRD